MLLLNLQSSDIWGKKWLNNTFFLDLQILKTGSSVLKNPQIWPIFSLQQNTRGTPWCGVITLLGNDEMPTTCIKSFLRKRPTLIAHKSHIHLALTYNRVVTKTSNFDHRCVKTRGMHQISALGSSRPQFYRSLNICKCLTITAEWDNMPHPERKNWLFGDSWRYAISNH